MQLIFSTDDIPKRDRVGLWTEAANKAFAKHSFKKLGDGAFQAKLHIAQLANLKLSRFVTTHSAVESLPHNLSSNPIEDCYIVLFKKTGIGIIRQDDRECTMVAGLITIIDPRRYFEILHIESLIGITVLVPRAQLEARVGAVANLMALQTSADDPLVELAFAYVCLLTDRVAKLDRNTETTVANHLLDLIGLAFAAQLERDKQKLSVSKSMSLVRLRATIDQHLHNFDLTPREFAAAAGISARYANELLSTLDTSLERYIIDRRLARCEAALRSPAQSHRTIGDIAYGWGFSDLSHFSRRFKAAFGHSPSEYRSRALEEQVLSGQ